MTRRIEPLQQGRRVGIRYEPGRVCEAVNCETQLSIYNGSDLCSLHEGLSHQLLYGHAPPRGTHLSYQ
jgi:hypothetical protein